MLETKLSAEGSVTPSRFNTGHWPLEGNGTLVRCGFTWQMAPIRTPWT